MPASTARQTNLDGLLSLSPSPAGLLTFPLCHSRHRRPGSPSCSSPAQPLLPNTGGSGPASCTPALAGSLASPATGPNGDVGVGFTPAASSDPDGETPSCRPGSGAAAARAFALPSSRRRPSASSVAAGASRAVTGVLGGVPGREGKHGWVSSASDARGGEGVRKI